MKLATLDNKTHDGQLIIVDRTLSRACDASEIARTLQGALDHWKRLGPRLHKKAEALGNQQTHSFDLDLTTLRAPLPRAYQFVDGSAYLSHVERVRKARHADMPESFKTDPLMYQAASDRFLAWHEPIEVADEEYGADFESEVAVITNEVPMGVTSQEASMHIALVVLINDVSLRNLIPDELAKGFGFLHGKPHSSMSPIAVTPDELGAAWHENKVYLPLLTDLNSKNFGSPDCGADMQFSFADLIAHAAKTRSLGAGTVVGSGTVSNYNQGSGYSCLMEKRSVEMIDSLRPSTPFLKWGDRVRIEMRDIEGNDIFGAIDQAVVQAKASGSR